MKTYKILSFAHLFTGFLNVSHTHIYKLGKDNRYSYCDVSYPIEQFINNHNFSIHSVERLSDNQVFTVNDSYRLIHNGALTVIKEFRIVDKTICIKTESDHLIFIESWGITEQKYSIFDIKKALNEYGASNTATNFVVNYLLNRNE